MWCYACSWDVRGDLTLNSMAQIHTSVTLLTSRDLTWSSGWLMRQHASHNLVVAHISWGVTNVSSALEYSTRETEERLRNTTTKQSDYVAYRSRYETDIIWTWFGLFGFNSVDSTDEIVVVWWWSGNITQKLQKTRGKIILISHRNISLIKQQFVLTYDHAILQDRKKYLDWPLIDQNVNTVFFTKF